MNFAQIDIKCNPFNISEGGSQVEEEADKDNKETEQEDDGLIGLAAMGIDQEKKHKGTDNKIKIIRKVINNLKLEINFFDINCC